MSKKAKNIVVVPRGQLARIVVEAAAGASQFSAVNRKADGTYRAWIVAPKGGRKFINGKGKTAPKPFMPKVFCVMSSQGRDARGRFQKAEYNGWRSLNAQTVEQVKVGRTLYQIADLSAPLAIRLT